MRHMYPVLLYTRSDGYGLYKKPEEKGGKKAFKAMRHFVHCGDDLDKHCKGKTENIEGIPRVVKLLPCNPGTDRMKGNGVDQVTDPRNKNKSYVPVVICQLLRHAGSKVTT